MIFLIIIFIGIYLEYFLTINEFKYDINLTDFSENSLYKITI